MIKTDPDLLIKMELKTKMVKKKMKRKLKIKLNLIITILLIATTSGLLISKVDDSKLNFEVESMPKSAQEERRTYIVSWTVTIQEFFEYEYLGDGIHISPGWVEETSHFSGEFSGYAEIEEINNQRIINTFSVSLYNVMLMDQLLLFPLDPPTYTLFHHTWATDITSDGIMHIRDKLLFDLQLEEEDQQLNFPNFFLIQVNKTYQVYSLEWGFPEWGFSDWYIGYTYFGNPGDLTEYDSATETFYKEIDVLLYYHQPSPITAPEILLPIYAHWSITVQVITITPEEAIDKIIEKIPDLPGESELSLSNQLDHALSKLEEARDFFNDGQLEKAEVRYYQAIGKVEDFIINVEDNIPSKIDPETGQELIDAAEALIDLIEKEMTDLGLG